VALYVVPVIREDAFSLYGFPSLAERETFAVLISVPKLGPRTGLAMLSSFTPEQLAATVAREDVRALTAVPGIGAKTARRILLDLKDRLASLDLDLSGPGGPVSGPPSVFEDTLGGLVALGYSENEASAAAESVLGEENDLDAGTAIRRALRILSGGGA
jgi:Holliday junction DNA helicase RuvA